MRNRRLFAAFLVSAALHAAVFILLFHFQKREPKREEVAARSIEMDIFEKNPPSASPPSQKVPETESSYHRSLRRTKFKNNLSPRGGIAGPAEAARKAPDSLLSLSDTPRRFPSPTELFPKNDLPGQPGGESGSGRTLHNRGSSGAEEDFARAETEARVKRRVEDVLNGEIASQRVANGLVDSYFSDMKAALQKHVSHAPQFELPRFGSRAVGAATSYAIQAERYGRTGNPYAESESHSPRSGDGIQDAEPQRFGGGLFAVIELRQASDGKLMTALLLKSSGNKKFDSYVLESAPNAIEQLASLPATGAGIHSFGTRSVWAFEGGLVYLKDIRKYTLKRDWPYLLGGVPLSILSGMPFDETTGGLGVYDVRDPQFTIDVRLLRVY